LAVGVVVAVLRVAEFVAGEHHRRTQREQQHADHVHGRLFACRNDVWIIGDAFDAEIGGMVHRRAIIIVFAVGFIVLGAVSGEVRQRETVVAGHEIDGGRSATPWFGGEQIGRAAESRGHLLQTDTPEIGAAVHILKPEGAGRVAEAVIPFGERHGELAGAPAEVAQIPRLHNELQVAQQQIGTQGVEERVMMGEFAFQAGQRDAKVEAETVYADTLGPVS